MLRTLLTASALLITTHIGQASSNMGMNKVYAETPVISFGLGNPGIQTPFVQPSWSVTVDNWDNYLTSNSTISGEGRVFTLKDKRLIAINAQTGKIIWTFKDDVQPMFVYQGGNILGALSDGSLYALSASSGKKLWQSSVKIENPNAIKLFGDTVYVTMNNYTVAVHLKTGKKLWRIINQEVPLKIEGGLAYSIKYNNQSIDESPERSITISVINVKSGEIKGNRVYRWSVSEGAGDENETRISTYFNGNDFYIHHNRMIEKYDFKNYKPDEKPLKSYSEPTYERELYPLNNVYRGRILFGKSQNGLLTSIKTVNGQDLTWIGDNPSAKTVIYGKGVYLAQTDGIMHALDFDTAKPLFRVKTGARQYDQILKEDGFLIIQTPDKLIGVKLPAALK